MYDNVKVDLFIKKIEKHTIYSCFINKIFSFISRVLSIWVDDLSEVSIFIQTTFKSSLINTSLTTSLCSNVSDSYRKPTWTPQHSPPSQGDYRYNLMRELICTMQITSLVYL